MPKSSDDDDRDNVIDLGFGSDVDPYIAHSMAWAALRPAMLDRLAELRLDPPTKLREWDTMLLDYAQHEGIGDLPPDVVARAKRRIAERKATPDADAEVIVLRPKQTPDE